MDGRKMVARVIVALLIVVNAQAHKNGAVVNAQAHKNGAVVNAQAHKNGGGDSTTKMLATLCGVATYKDACMKSLQAAAHRQGVTPQMLVERGVKLALVETEKASANPALKTCKHLLQQAKDRLQEAMTQVCDANNFKDQAQLFNIRIELGDVNTFATTCVDEAPPQLQQLFKAGTSSATQLSIDMLDVVTIFNQQLSHQFLLPSLITNRRLLASS